MREQLMELLLDICPDTDFEHEDKLVTDGVLDSFDIIALVNEMNEVFEIKIPIESLLAENFDSVDAILATIKKLKEEAEDD